MEVVFFWLFLVVHVAHGIRVLVWAEELERAKRASADARHPFTGATKLIFAGVLFLPGFVFAELRWLWLGLALFTIVAGCFVLVLAMGYVRQGAAGEELVPEEEIADRARQRRAGILVRIALLGAWIYAWRGYL